MDDEIMQLIEQGKGILFTFYHEAREYASQHHLEIELHECEFDDDDHLLVLGFGAKLYWIAR